MALKPYIRAALESRSLDAQSAQEAMGIVMRGEATSAQIAAWLVALRMKAETAAELTGFVRAMRDAMVPLKRVPELAIDTCGTGGDDLGTFNISTAAALAVAACGVPVAKHGNKAVSSRCGSADVLEALGFRIDAGPDTVAGALEHSSFAFLYAPRFHPAMKHAAGPRREIGVRTVFNLLGPLCNPARVKRQMVGVFDRHRASQIAEVLGVLGAERALVVSGPDGADELLPTGPNQICEWDGKRLREYTISPADLGVEHCTLDDLRGGEAADNAAIINRIASGEDSPKAETVMLNAGAALYVAGHSRAIVEGVAAARKAIRSGAMADVIAHASAASRDSSSAGG